jgi:DNA-directed RNA polymerase specialized sigma24 family protein
MSAETRANDTARSRRWADVGIRSDEEKDEGANLVEYVEKRASFLRREYDLDDKLARALGWRELGFSSSGIGDMMDITEGTAEKYLDSLRREVGDDYVDKPAPPVGKREIERPLPGFLFRGDRR